MTAWDLAQDGVRLAVKVQPKSRRPGLLGLVPDVAGMRLKLGVAEPAEDGRANRAVCAMVAKALGVSQSEVVVTQGATSRQKLLFVSGEAGLLAERLAALCKVLTGDDA